jgi:cbb3-type cytochrome oxidase maturation protein
VGWAIALAVVIIIVIPVAVLMTGAGIAALLGWTLKNEGEEDANEELINLS